jgi:hypothetical protein
MMYLLEELRTRVLQLCMQAACDVAFPVEIADNLVAAEELLRAMVTKPATNDVLSKVDVELILHARLDP